jgi:hypothetical protein
MKTLRELINLIESADRDRDSYQPGYIPGVRDPEDGSDLEPGLPGVTKSFFGIDDKIKAKIQDIVVKISDMPGMWDHQAQTFTDQGMAKLKARLKDNPRYIRYAVNLTADDYEAESVQEGIISSFLKNRVNAGTTPKEVAASTIRQLNQRAPGTKMEGHPNFSEFKQAVYDYIASAENSMEAIRRASDDHVISLGKKYFKSGESEAPLEETQQVEEDPVARVEQLAREIQGR